ncbi:mandelate racemase/muconate lactonizing enzyme family protein [Parabacteroides chinchillae]|uniref:Enolase C-terminal domain-like n=1 Tax=Parabacteroides chinchillae TaxID=871327 RepID=A0A8G2F0N0_9BACT|nr:mandelate racemase/muconate lactonizing enzyme family protein [Parabacteroides chinchillae]SEF58397.1 Enolase C-terminal domain-like [Parabacteroides chinchillae]
MDRRSFMKNLSMMAASSDKVIDMLGLQKCANKITGRSIKIADVGLNFEREPLIRPFGFKGGYLSELWQSICLLESESGIRKIGVGTQSILWSDSSVFTEHSESAGNALMLALTEKALGIIKGKTFYSPMELLDEIFEEVYEYGKVITGNHRLRKTFVLNALVGVDNAAWLLYAAENGISSFDDMVPEVYRKALSLQHKQVACIPLISYNVSPEEMKHMVSEGYFFPKIKIGQPGTQEDMLKKDCDRLTEIHQTIGHITTPHTENGKILYYLDANGRYEKKETLLRFIDHARKIGAYEQIAIIEEPFPEEYDIDVNDVDIRIAADESAHTDRDALIRIEMGYKAIALKAVAKTMSMTMKIAQIAYENNIPCFCADLTASPFLAEWNKNIAARLLPFPGLKVGLLETNGNQNYKNWKQMQTYSPSSGEEWTTVKDGIYNLNEEYYARSGGLFEPSAYYDRLLESKKPRNS